MHSLLSYSVSFSTQRDTLDRKFWYVRGGIQAESMEAAAQRCALPGETIREVGKTVGGKRLFALSSGLFVRVKLEGCAMPGHRADLEPDEIAYARQRALAV